MEGGSRCSFLLVRYGTIQCCPVNSAALQLLEGGNMRRSVRLRSLYSDKRRSCCLFDNRHHRDTAAASGPAQAASGEDLLAAADWWVVWGLGSSVQGGQG